MELQITNLDGQSGGSVSVADKVFAHQFNEALVHQVLVAYWAGARSGTRAQKTRSEVRGGGAKPWRQKGTGRARAGTIRSPIWRGGGVTFAAKPKDYSQKVNKKMYRAAMRSIFSELVRQDRLIVVDQPNVAEPKTRLVVGLLKDFGVDGSALFITKEINSNLLLGSRNLLNVDVCDVQGLNPDSLIRFDKVIICRASLDHVGEWLA